MDAALRSSLWNLFDLAYLGDQWQEFAKFVAIHVVKVPVDDVPLYANAAARSWLKDVFLGAPWHGAYDILEFAVRHVPSRQVSQIEFEAAANAFLEREGSGYRFIKGLLTPITEPSELEAVESAIVETERVGLDGASTH